LLKFDNTITSLIYYKVDVQVQIKKIKNIEAAKKNQKNNFSTYNLT